MVNWAANYLIKSALEKEARWVRKLVAILQKMTPAQRAKFFKKYDFTDLQDKPVRQATPRQLYQYFEWLMAKKNSEINKVWTEPKRATPGGFKSEMFVPTGEAPVLAESLPQDPKNVIYRANRASNAVFRSGPTFGTGYPVVAEDYATRPAGTIVLQMKTPEGAEYSPHIMITDPKHRARYMKKNQMREQDYGEGALHYKPPTEFSAQPYPYYEALMTLKDPAQILKAWKTTSDKPGAPMVPVKWQDMPERELQGRIREADWWETPIQTIKKPKPRTVYKVGRGPRWMTGKMTG